MSLTALTRNGSPLEPTVTATGLWPKMWLPGSSRWCAPQRLQSTHAKRQTARSIVGEMADCALCYTQRNGRRSRALLRSQPQRGHQHPEIRSWLAATISPVGALRWSRLFVGRAKNCTALWLNSQSFLVNRLGQAYIRGAANGLTDRRPDLATPHTGSSPSWPQHCGGCEQKGTDHVRATAKHRANQEGL
jgi:hypothetical protein